MAAGSSPPRSVPCPEASSQTSGLQSCQKPVVPRPEAHGRPRQPQELTLVPEELDCRRSGVTRERNSLGAAGRRGAQDAAPSARSPPRGSARAATPAVCAWPCRRERGRRAARAQGSRPAPAQGHRCPLCLGGPASPPAGARSPVPAPWRAGRGAPCTGSERGLRLPPGTCG